MADWEDWEAAAEKDVQEIKAAKIGEEVEAVDIDAKEDIKIKSQPKNAEKAAKKEKQTAISKKWDEKEKQYEDIFNDQKGPRTAEQRKKDEQLSKESDAKNTIDLFGGLIEKTEATDLKTEQAFVDFAKKTAEILVKGDRKKYIQEFMKELLQQIYPKLTSTEYEDIHSKCTILFNQKTKEEKGTGPKKKTAAKLNVSKANAAAKMMGYDEGSDEDEGYGGGRNDNYDFM